MQAPNTVFPPGICTYTVFSPAKPFVLPLALVKYGFHPVLNEPARYLTLAAIIVEWGAASLNPSWTVITPQLGEAQLPNY